VVVTPAAPFSLKAPIFPLKASGHVA
jgi:hypothetical protein